MGCRRTSLEEELTPDSLNALSRREEWQNPAVTLPPESYVDSMPCDQDLLLELGRVQWAAARLHAGVRDAINRHDGQPSDQAFKKTLGQAVRLLEDRARAVGRTDQLDWVTNIGRPAVKKRNRVTHAVTFTASDGRQAIGTVDQSAPGRFLRAELREVALHLIHASMTLPT